MKKLIIPQKASNTGSIHDIASQHFDREIKFPKGAKYAIVLSAYYGGKGYTTHGSESATIQADDRQAEYSRQIIGVDGWSYYVDNGELRRDIDQRDPYVVEDFVEITKAAAALGASSSNKKVAASRANGRKGGRPKKV